MLGITKFLDWSSVGKCLTAITSINDAESAMYYTSVVISAIKGCISDATREGCCLIYLDITLTNQHQHNNPNHVVYLALVLGPCF